MVVFMVTLYPRVSMRRSTGLSPLFSLLRSSFAGTLVLASIISCADSTSPVIPKDGIPIQVNSVDIFVSDSAKQAEANAFAGTLLTSPVAISRSRFVSPAAALSTSSGTCGTGSDPVDYVVTKLPDNYAPASIPMYAPYPLTPDGYIDENSVPLGFTFDFYGKSYDKVNIWSNGFLMFGPAPQRSGFFMGDQIPFAANPNNIIAVAWSDWEPQLAVGSIRFETRGSPGSRMFIMQYNNTPEYKGTGVLMAQVILYEGSNDITIYTNTMSTSNPGARITQGIENSDGTQAAVGPPVVINPATGLSTPRVRGVFKLTNDGLKFSRPRNTDSEAPVIAAPADVVVGNDHRLASALVSVAAPSATDNCTEPVVTGVRGDGAAFDAPYPVGVTKITWTAKDAAGNTSTLVQSVTVEDREAPELDNPGNLSVNATSPSGAVVKFTLHPWDNVGVTSLVCTPASNTTFGIANNQPVTCSAADAAGNATQISFLVSVIDAPTQTMNLIQYIISLQLGNGTTNPLVNQLQQAFDGTEPSCKKMDDFLHLLDVKGGEIPEANMLWIRTEAARIMNVMSCATPAVRRFKPKG
jgi:hypothetical protein